VDPRQLRRQSFRELNTWLTRVAQERTLVLLIANVHWADPDSRLLLGFLLDGADASRTLVVATENTEASARSAYLDHPGARWREIRLAQDDPASHPSEASEETALHRALPFSTGSTRAISFSRGPIGVEVASNRPMLACVRSPSPRSMQPHAAMRTSVWRSASTQAETTPSLRCNTISPPSRSGNRPGAPKVAFAKLVFNLGPAASAPATIAPSFPGTANHVPYKEAKAQLLDSFDRAYVSLLLERHKNNVSQAAAAAGLSRKHLYELIRRVTGDDGEGEGPQEGP
jgi:hypothetical protein